VQQGSNDIDPKNVQWNSKFTFPDGKSKPTERRGNSIAEVYKEVRQQLRSAIVAFVETMAMLLGDQWRVPDVSDIISDSARHSSTSSTTSSTNSDSDISDLHSSDHHNSSQDQGYTQAAQQTSGLASGLNSEAVGAYMNAIKPLGDARSGRYDSS
jgi:hypothetical protein